MDFRLFNQDAIEWLATIRDETVDLVVTDPAYESLEKHRKHGTTTRLKNSKSSSNEWFEIFPNDRFPEFLAHIYRILRRNTHFYMFCDSETMFVVKPMAEEVGFKFWKPLVWDKCLDPTTPILTTEGVKVALDIRAGDKVITPGGTASSVIATRFTKDTVMSIHLSDGTTLRSSLDHRYILHNGTEIEARGLKKGDRLFCQGDIVVGHKDKLNLADIIPEEKTVLELPSVNECLWCGKEFDSSRATSAHQARFCKQALSKKEMAKQLHVPQKRLRWWFNQRRIPREWAEALGILDKCSGRLQYVCQNNTSFWFPESVLLNFELGKLIGLYAAEGSKSGIGISFALHREEKHLQHHVERMVRLLGMKASTKIEGNRAVVRVGYRLAEYLVDHFIGGHKAVTKYLKQSVYEAPFEFRRGVFWGLLEGDGYWSSKEQRETFVNTSADLSFFVLRMAQSLFGKAKITCTENEHAGFYSVRFSPTSNQETDVLEVIDVSPGHRQTLIDLSIDDPSELFFLANGAVTHNCAIGMGYHYRARYEFILFFEKGKRKINDLAVSDILTVKRIFNGFPAEKPYEVVETLIKQSSNEYELVLDPFCGSASAGEAALRNNRCFFGNDLCEEAVRFARIRLEAIGGVEQHPIKLQSTEVR